MLANRLIKSSDFSSKENHINVLDFLNQLIQFDEKNDSILVSSDDSVKEFVFDDYKNELRFYSNIISIVGRVLTSSFRADNYNYNDTHHWAINTSEMLQYAHDQLCIMKKELDEKKENTLLYPYGANCVLVSLIEFALKRNAKINYIKRVCVCADSKIKSGQLTLSDYDLDYFGEINNSYINGKSLKNGRNEIVASGIQFKKFIDTYGLSLNYSNDFEKKIFEGTLTLNQLLQVTEETNTWEPTFLEAMNNVFGTSKLNLRNHLAHCGYTIYNYHSPYTSFLLNEFLYLVASDFYLKR